MTETIGELCMGYGGLGRGLSMALGGDTRIAWGVEYDGVDKRGDLTGPKRILAHRYPDMPLLHDVKTTRWEDLEPVDWLTAGFPCQPFSHAGLRRGERDERHLWPYIAHGISILRPAGVLLENVGGLLSIGDDFDEPGDRCLCGWPLRRGGVRGSGSDPWGLDDFLCDGDDDPCEASAHTSGSGVRREGAPAPGCDGQVGGSLDVVPARDGGGFLPAPGSAASGHQARGCRDGSEDRVRSVVAQADLNRSVPLDAGSVGALLDAASSDQGTEPAWAGTADLASASGATGCPSCGRDVGEAAVGSAFRSGMGTVLGDLARLGYDARWCRVRASDAGAPHSRARVFIVATSTDAAAQRRRGTEGEQRGVGPAGLFAHPVADAGSLGRDARRGAGPTEAARRRASADAAGRRNPSPADAARDGRGEGRTEPAQLVRRPDAAERGLPTLADADSDGCARLTGLPAERRAVHGDSGRDPDGRGAVVEWGAYGPAIARWERVLGRPAPRPTEPGRRGERLSPRFVEFLMGLPAGWVTDVPGLPRNAQLKALGNGVVPHQAALACRLLGVTAEAVAA